MSKVVERDERGKTRRTVVVILCNNVKYPSSFCQFLLCRFLRFKLTLYCFC